MEVLQTSDCVVTNHEALAFLREQRENIAEDNRKQSGKVATLVLETLASLEQGGNSIALRNRLSFRLKNRSRVPFSKDICINCKNTIIKIRLKNRLSFPLKLKRKLKGFFNAIESPPRPRPPSRARRP